MGLVRLNCLFFVYLVIFVGLGVLAYRKLTTPEMGRLLPGTLMSVTGLPSHFDR